MRKLLFLLLLSVFFCSLSGQTDSIKSANMMSNEVNLSAKNSERINKLEQSLISFRRNNRISQVLTIGGALFGVSTIFVNEKSRIPMAAIGSVLVLSGTITYIYSFSAFDFDRKKPKKKIDTDFY